MPRFLTDCVGNAAFCTFGSIQTSALQKPEKYPEMRSAQASFDTRAIMKKFIYVCNSYTTSRVVLYELSILRSYE